jgi:hypothetical protein
MLLFAATLLSCKSKTQRSAEANQRSAEAQAAADLAKGAAAIMMASGVVRYPLTPDVDSETGLPFNDMGCALNEQFQDAYNGAIHAWIKDHGLPANSLKQRFIETAAVDEALHRGAELAPGTSSLAPDGRRIELRGDALLVQGGAFTQPFQRPLGLGSGAKVRFAWAPNAQVLVQIDGPAHAGFSGRARVQIDPGCRCLLQVLR